MNAIRFDWRAAMADATAEQHADLAVLVAASAYRDPEFRAWCRAQILREPPDSDWFFRPREIVSRAHSQSQACAVVAWTIVAAMTFVDDANASQTRELIMGKLGLLMSHAGWSGLSEADISMAIDAVLSGEAPRFLDAMGKK